MYGAEIWSGVYGGTVSGQYGLMIGLDNIGGTVNSRYGLYLATPDGTAVTDDFGIYQEGPQKNYFAGNVGWIWRARPCARVSRAFCPQ